ncbi:MAG TPA: hypothetical protein VD973_21665 [Symbiobacteriaceae bacterium]|nr:hypothetical protein [Symbiobacteriaceae bacterium]
MNLFRWTLCLYRRRIVAALLSVALLFSTAGQSQAMGDEERDEEKVALWDWTLRIDGESCNLYGTPMLLWRSSIFLPARRAAACAGWDYTAYTSWLPRIGGAMVIGRTLNAWRPEGIIQRLSLTGYPEDPDRSTVENGSDDFSVTIEHGGLHPFEWAGANYVWSRGLTDALGAYIAADFANKTVTIQTDQSPVVAKRATWADWNSFRPRSLHDNITYHMSAAAVRNMLDYYLLTRGRGPDDDMLRKLDIAGAEYLDDWQNSRIRVYVPGSRTVATDIYANGSGERYVVLWLHNQAKADAWIESLEEQAAMWGEGAKAVTAGTSVVTLMAYLLKEAKGLSTVSPYMVPITAVANITSYAVARDYRLDIAAARGCIESASGASVGVILRRYQGHGVVGCVTDGYTDAPVNSAGNH